MPKEGALSEAGTLSDVGDSRLLEPALHIELHCSESESPAGVGLPPGHGLMVQDDSD